MMTINFKRESFPTPIPTLLNSNIHPQSCIALFDKVPEVTLKKGDVLFREGDTPHFVYLVIKGMIKLYSLHDGKEMLEDYLQKGDFLNCEAVIGEIDKNKTVEAMTQMTVIKKIPISTFQKIIQTNPKLYAELLSNISGTLNRTQERLRRLILLSSQQRVIHFIALHVKKSGRQVGFEYVLKPPLTHQEIGNIAGAGRQTVTTIMNELRRDNIIHFTRQYLIVRDMDRLLALSGMKY